MIEMSSNESNKQNNNTEEKEEKKTITIRGVDDDLYKKAVLLARETGRNVGDIVNQALKSFLSITENATRTVSTAITHVTNTGKEFVQGLKEAGKEVIVISDLKEVEVDREELINLGKPASFRNIDRLVLTNITQEDIDKYIDSIILVKEVVVPPTINKLKLLQKCKFVDKVTVLKT